MGTKTSSRNSAQGSDVRKNKKKLRQGKSKNQTDKYFIDEHGKRVKVRKGSFLDLAWDIIGSVHGPGDLTTNKDRWKDYGR